jgi:hypothetical protein
LDRRREHPDTHADAGADSNRTAGAPLVLRVEPPAEGALMSRDRDVRNAIQAALAATGEFDPNAVWIWGLPENYGTGASQFAAAAIEPLSSTQADNWDSQTAGGLVVTSRVVVTLLYRCDDPEVRDEAAELLFDTAANALNGQSLAGLTMPGLTRFESWAWQTPTPPERRIKATLSYAYIVEGWDAYDTTP